MHWGHKASPTIGWRGSCCLGWRRQLRSSKDRVEEPGQGRNRNQGPASTPLFTVETQTQKGFTFPLFVWWCCGEQGQLSKAIPRPALCRPPTGNFMFSMYRSLPNTVSRACAPRACCAMSKPRAFCSCEAMTGPPGLSSQQFWPWLAGSRVGPVVC